MSETEAEQPPNPDTNPQPPNEPEEPAPDPQPDPEPEEPPAACPPYPNDSSITCEHPPGHSPRMMHRRQTGGPDSPTYEWE